MHQPPSQLRIAGVVYELAAGEQLRITAQLGDDGEVEVVRAVVEPQAVGGGRGGPRGAEGKARRGRNENGCV